MNALSLADIQVPRPFSRRHGGRKASVVATPRQAELLTSVMALIQEGVTPSLRTLSAQGFGHPTSVDRLLLELEKRGYIAREPYTSGIRVLKGPEGRPVVLRFVEEETVAS